MAGFAYTTNLNAVVNALRDYNTSTSNPDLSNNLPRRIDKINIKSGDPDVEMIRSDRLPAIFVRPDSSEEEFSSIGQTGPTKNMKEKTVIYSIFAMFGRSGGSQRHIDGLTSVMDMVQNIEAVFQAEFQLSGTALWCHPRRTEISNVPLDASGRTWIKTAMVELQVKYFFR